MESRVSDEHLAPLSVGEWVLGHWALGMVQELTFSLWLGPKNYLLFPKLCSLLKPDFGSPEIGRYIGSKTSVDSRFPDASEL